MRALRRATRTLAHLSAEAPLWEASMMTAELQPDNFIEPPNGTILVNPIARQAAREAIPKNVVWLTALEYSRKFNDILDPLGQSVLTEGYLRKKNDLYGKLFHNADKYLIANKDLDDVSAREAWQRWFEEVEEHMWWWRLQRWRVQCFTEANLEILPPGPLREETRYTHVVDMPFSMQEAVWRARQDWLPEAARLDNIPSPTLVARRSHEGRAQIVAAIKAAEDKLLAEARDAADKDIVRAVANQYYLCADPTGPRSSRHPHITVDAIKKATDVDTLAQWMLLVQLDNFDDRVFAIAARACELRKDAKGAALAEWCRGLVQRDVDAATRKVDGVKFEPLPPTEEEKKLGALPAHVGEVRDKASYDAFRAYFADINPALSPVLPPDVQKWWGKATEYCLEEWDKLVAAGKFGRELRLAQYAATARAWAEAHPDLAKTQYPPPLPPVKKDEHGTRMIARLVGAYGGAGILDAAHKYDEDFVVDILTQLDWKLVPAAQVEELIAEYPSLGLPQGRLTAAHKERLALSGMPVQKLLA